MATGALALGLLLGSSGCVYYGNYPGERDLTWWNARESAGLLELMEQSLSHVIEQDLATQPELADPPAGEPLVAINLPGRISPESYRRVARRSHPQAVPLSEGRSDLPVYHIGQIQIRGGSAVAEVLRPVTGLERGVSDPPLAGVQIWYEGRSGSWRMVRERRREVGTLGVPRVVPIELLERAVAMGADPRTQTIDEAELAAMEAERRAAEQAAASAEDE
ncbi:MAG: hypothetical protein ACTS22_08020 [Phycisphaerales bacterium]